MVPSCFLYVTYNFPKFATFVRLHLFIIIVSLTHVFRLEISCFDVPFSPCGHTHGFIVTKCNIILKVMVESIESGC